MSFDKKSLYHLTHHFKPKFPKNSRKNERFGNFKLKNAQLLAIHQNMASFYHFDFTCGNFTTGNGHFFSRNARPTQDILKHLEDAGEKNCTVILNRLDRKAPVRPVMEIDSSKDFQYRVTNRWYNTVGTAVARVAPVVIPMILQGGGGEGGGNGKN